MTKMTVHQVLTAINDIRKSTSQNVQARQNMQADAMLLALQERLLNDYGGDPQTTEF